MNYISYLAILSMVLMAVFMWLRRMESKRLFMTLMGAVGGLLIGELASAPLRSMPTPYDVYGPLLMSGSLLVMGVAMVNDNKSGVHKMLARLTGALPQTTGSASAGARRVVVDTSAIIDGRISDIAETGFAPSVLIVPRFVLAELQNIADSEDAMRRGRGRRGLEVLNNLREMKDIVIEITDEDSLQIKEVDAKLVYLAQKLKCDILTTDYNLNRVAQIQNVRVLNVNELSNAIRPVVLPGEIMRVKVVQAGKERNQGVAYLEDGTMIVVENGDKLMDQDVTVEVTRVFQTVAGKMIFAVPKQNEDRNTVQNHASTKSGAHRQNEATKAGSTHQAVRNDDIKSKPAQKMTNSEHVIAEPVKPRIIEPVKRAPRHHRGNSSSASIEDRLVQANNTPSDKQ